MLREAGRTGGNSLAGFTSEVDEPIPAHLSEWWAGEAAHCMHSAPWWRKHWERSGAVDVAVADTLPDGWQLWRDWLQLVAPENESEIRTVETDAGSTFGYVRAIGHRRQEAKLFDPLLTVPAEYAKKPLLRES